MVPSSSSGTNSVPSRGSTTPAATTIIAAIPITTFLCKIAHDSPLRYPASKGFNTTLSRGFTPFLNRYVANAGTIISATNTAESMANIILIAIG